MSQITTPSGTVLFRDDPITQAEYRQIQLPFVLKNQTALYDAQDVGLNILIEKITLAKGGEITEKGKFAVIISSWPRAHARLVIEAADKFIQASDEIPNSKEQK